MVSSVASKPSQTPRLEGEKLLGHASLCEESRSSHGHLVDSLSERMICWSPFQEPRVDESFTASFVREEAEEIEIPADLQSLGAAGEPSRRSHTGTLCLPVVAARANGQSWTNVARRMAVWVQREMRADWDKQECCMSQSTQLQITRSVGESTVVLKRRMT
jgi:hypothetical protein